MPGVYEEDLAFVHDAGFGDFSDRAGRWLLELLASKGWASGTVVDLGCGSGIWARRAVAAGYEVRGVDISPAMVELAQKAVPDSCFETGSFHQYRLGSCVLVTALGEPLAYLADAENSREPLASLFDRVYRALEPGGLFVFDLREPGQPQEGVGQSRATLGPDWAVIYRVEESRSARLLTRHITTFRKTWNGYRRVDEEHHLRLYEGPSVLAELRRIGFRARLVRSFGDLELEKAHAGFIARKPRTPR